MSRFPVTELSEASALPRLASAACAALNRLYNGAPPLPLALQRVQGELRLVFDPVPLRGVEPHGRFAFKVGPHTGHLGLDSIGLAALTGEPRIDLLPRELRTILLADALHPLTEALQSALRLHFEWSADEVNGAPDLNTLICFAFARDDGHVVARGVAVLDDPAALDKLVPAFKRHPAPTPAAFDRLQVQLRFEVGSTPIQWQEVRRIAPGDIVGIERWRAAGSALHLQASVAGLRLDALADGSRITLQSLGDIAMNTAPTAADTDAASQLPLDRLDALEVSLRFEVGGLALTLGELKALKPGHVFELGEPLNRSTVRILAHGNVLGKGHLVAVGDRLGVRVAEFAAGAL
ncbi:type III secretion system cytoplasmic ring protein SctQ [Ideonella sp. BN130291]|uniref:type III secretion system cytoplasmic ring protein SctQ n=1 Tax=Ideonella sp. BN130291 TaxID=3112940 RepID=UPI002E265BAE|nr:type III secretion system cytoplasmic ring protein SctQ [Ideonella sp. BN130291]